MACVQQLHAHGGVQLKVAPELCCRSSLVKQHDWLASADPMPTLLLPVCPAYCLQLYEQRIGAPSSVDLRTGELNFCKCCTRTLGFNLAVASVAG
jgi:hypothetical protein